MLRNYLTTTLRNLTRQKGYTLINIVGLAAGMACCLLIALYVWDELSFDRFHEHADRLYRLEQTVDANQQRWSSTSALHGPAVAQAYPEVEAQVRFFVRGYLGGYQQRQAYNTRVAFVDPAVLEVFSFTVLAGDAATMLARPGGIVITAALRDQLFDREDPIGQTVTLNHDDTYTVTGVLDVPHNSTFDGYFDALVPFSTVWEDYAWLDNWGASTIQTFILLREGTSPEALEAKFPALVAEHEGEGITTAFHLLPLPDIRLRPQNTGATGTIGVVYLFIGVALLVLFIACINYINLATARATRRMKEVGMRKVLGAHRTQLVRQFLSESMVLAVVGLGVGLLLVELALPYVNDLTGKALSLDLIERFPTMLVLVGLCLLVGIGAGVYPAFYLARFQPASLLQHKGASAQGSPLLRQVLVVTQFAASITLIIGTFLIQQQLAFLTEQKLGFNGEQVLSVRLQGGDRAAINTFKQELLRMPHVQGVGQASSHPGRIGWQMSVTPVGASDAENEDLVYFQMVDEDYLETMQIEMAAGRSFSADRAADSTSSILLNEAAVALFGFTTPQEALGKRYDVAQYTNVEVVGVVQDFHFASMRQEIKPLVIALGTDALSNMAVRVQPEDIGRTVEEVEALWERILPEWPFVYSFIDADFEALYRAEQRTGQIFAWFAGLALFVASLGLFGLASYTIQQRTKEIGIRKVFGASMGQIVALLSRRFLVLVLLAFTAAVPIVYLGMSAWLSGFAYHTVIGAGPFVLTGVLALAAAFLTISYQAFRAARANPAQSLRYE